MIHINDPHKTNFELLPYWLLCTTKCTCVWLLRLSLYQIFEKKPPAISSGLTYRISCKKWGCFRIDLVFFLDLDSDKQFSRNGFKPTVPRFIIQSILFLCPITLLQWHAVSHPADFLTHWRSDEENQYILLQLYTTPARAQRQRRRAQQTKSLLEQNSFVRHPWWRFTLKCGKSKWNLIFFFLHICISCHHLHTLMLFQEYKITQNKQF